MMKEIEEHIQEDLDPEQKVIQKFGKPKPLEEYIKLADAIVKEDYDMLRDKEFEQQAAKIKR